MNLARRILLAVVLLLLTAAWGSVGHRIINTNVVVHLPAGMNAFIQQQAFLAAHASDADNRKGGDSQKPYILKEGPRHFIDIDAYPEFATKSVPQNLSTLIARSDSFTVFDIGINPWTIAWNTDSLTAQLRRGDWTRAWQTSADLGHYVGDAYQPLHNTKDYDGRSSVPGSSGIHSRYETGMLSSYQNLISILPDTVHFVANPLAFAFAITYESNSFVDSIYAADVYARQTSGWSGSGSVPAAYYAALWSKVGSFTEYQIQHATQDYASLLYTAWVNAGSPAMTSASIAGNSGSLPTRAVLNQNFPNPFNPSTTISYQVPGDAHVTLSVYALNGSKIAVLANRTVTAGTYQTNFDASSYGLSSGIYLYRLEVRSHGNLTTSTNKMLLLK